MKRQARGTFVVKTMPLPPDTATNGTNIGRWSLDKQYEGDLVAASTGEMLGAGQPAAGTAGYVAIEQVNGTVDGLAGTFALQHFGTMSNGDFSLDIRIVPASGTDGFEGIAGTLQITQKDGTHSYSLDYTLPDGKSS